MRSPNSYISKPAQYNGSLNLINSLLGISVVILAVIVLLLFVRPIQFEPEERSDDIIESVLSSDFSALLQSDTADNTDLAEAIRPGLFKSATPLRGKPMADKTVEKIKSKLKLQCILEMDQEPVAYINIDGVGLKQCRSGQSINDLFIVLDINKDNVEISIVDHKVLLRM